MNFTKIITAISLVFLIFGFWRLKTAVALENNLYGIHLSSPADLDNAADLVNQNGDWGYVTIVIQENDRFENKWQSFFDDCRTKHLIPIVRIATKPQGSIWEKPQKEIIKDWVSFLGSLNWPIKNRYVVIYNEPNHAKEWGGLIEPEYYAQILNEFIEALKSSNMDYFVMNAGLDQAAPNGKMTMDAYQFLSRMHQANFEIFNKLDGWVSHSYPNHGFIGKPWETGKASVKGYEWELSVLKNNFNLKKDLPIFITETGWPHTIIQNSKIKNQKYYSPEIVADYFNYAFKNIWLHDERIVAVTPFILNYPYEPFSNFSWMDLQGNFYPQYETIKNQEKVKGDPEQITDYEVTKISYPRLASINSTIKGNITLKNIGQSIWGEKAFTINSSYADSALNLSDDARIKPGEKYTFQFEIHLPNISGIYKFNFSKTSEYQIYLFDTWHLTIPKENLFLKIISIFQSFLSEPGKI